MPNTHYKVPIWISHSRDQKLVFECSCSRGIKFEKLLWFNEDLFTMYTYFAGICIDVKTITKLHLFGYYLGLIFTQNNCMFCLSNNLVVSFYENWIGMYVFPFKKDLKHFSCMNFFMVM